METNKCEKCNIGAIDRLFRLMAAVIIGSVGLITDSYIGLIAIAPLFSAVFGYCPYYKIFKLDTRLDQPNTPSNT